MPVTAPSPPLSPSAATGTGRARTVGAVLLALLALVLWVCTFPEAWVLMLMPTGTSSDRRRWRGFWAKR
jgi:hypothetical protein